MKRIFIALFTLSVMLPLVGCTGNSTSNTSNSRSTNSSSDNFQKYYKSGYEDGYEDGFRGLNGDYARTLYVSQYGAPSTDIEKKQYQKYVEGYNKGKREGTMAR